jgi:uncharacterized protein
MVNSFRLTTEKINLNQGKQMNKSIALGLLSAIIVLISNSVSADNGKPDLWKVEKGGKSSYLFGSIHLGSQDMYPLSKKVKEAYAQAENLVVEIDLKPGDEQKLVPLIQQLGVDMTSPLESRLSPKTLAVYKKACTEKTLPCAQFAPLKAWFLSLQLQMMLIQQLGYKEELGIDKHFLELARKTGKNVIGLETADSQLKMLSGFNQQQQELMLVQSLEASKEEMESLFKAWKTGDDAAIVKLFAKDIDKAGAQEIYDVMITERNIEMAKNIQALLAQDKSLFVVVGAGHIVGELGLVDLLTKVGYKLTQLQ